MTNPTAFLGMDVAAMTTNDWLGVFFVLVSAIGMAVAYITVLRPSNKEKFESRRSMALDDDDPIKMGDRK